MIIKPKEAEGVKWIYREYLEGASLAQIGNRWHPDSGKKGKMAVGNIEGNIVGREVYRKCPATENLYSEIPFQEVDQEQWHCITVLCGEQL